VSVAGLKKKALTRSLFVLGISVWSLGGYFDAFINGNLLEEFMIGRRGPGLDHSSRSPIDVRSQQSPISTPIQNTEAFGF